MVQWMHSAKGGYLQPIFIVYLVEQVILERIVILEDHEDENSRQPSEMIPRKSKLRKTVPKGSLVNGMKSEELFEEIIRICERFEESRGLLILEWL